MVSGQPAAIGSRVVAIIIDGIIQGIIGWILVTILGGAEIGSIVSFVIGMLDYVYFLPSQNGQTPGKIIMGIRVVRQDGTPVTVSTAILRYRGYFVNTIALSIGWLWVFVDKDQRGWHDLIAGTVVVKA